MRRKLSPAVKAAIAIISPLDPKEYPWKYQALRNLIDYPIRMFTDAIPTTIHQAVDCFRFLETSEGAEYWRKLFYGLQNEYVQKLKT